MNNEIQIEKYYHKNGMISMQFPRLNGKFHGVMTRWYDSGSIHYEYTCIHGLMQGVDRLWNQDGTLDVLFQLKNNQAHGPKAIFRYK